MNVIFTSCMDATRDARQDIWIEVAKQKPDVLMLLGDQIYMDWGDLGASNWRTLIQKEPDKGLEAFATEMHRRYSAQWGVASFQNLICGFAGRGDPSKLLVTWDDHDFAWNNCLGEDNTNPALANFYKHGVPDLVKHISRRLFDQFLVQLRTAHLGASYPDMQAMAELKPPLVGAQAEGLFWMGNLSSGQGPNCLLLDSRWGRQARLPVSGVEPSLLGTTQRMHLIEAIGKEGNGLLVVACGTPVSHEYRFGNDGWRSSRPDRESSYVEYHELLAGAKRPVLFLSGDVHRNTWSGQLINRTTGVKSEVVQVLASAAAIGKYHVKRFAPSFAIAKLPDTKPVNNGTIDLTFYEQQKNRTWSSSITTVPPLSFNARNWTSAADSIDADAFNDYFDLEPLYVFAAHPRTSQYKNQTDITVDFKDDLSELDAVHQHGTMPAGSYPEPLWLQVNPAIAKEPPKVNLDFKGNLWQGNKRTDEITQLMVDAFANAKAKGKKSVVLFIHGVGKVFSTAASEAYSLRAYYPDCEPILYKWSAGTGGSTLGALTSVGIAHASAKNDVVSLSTALTAFGEIAKLPSFAGMAKVILARSAGTLALQETLSMSINNYSAIFSSVDRVVLSSALLKTNDFKNKQGVLGLTIPIVWTSNEHDHTLKSADWIDGWRAPLGLGSSDTYGSGHCIGLNFTHSPGVNSLHDYLFLDINDKQLEVNRRLLVEKGFNPANLPHLLQPSAGSTHQWDVL